MGAFVVLVAILFNYATDWVRVSPEDIASGLIWMTIMFAGLLGVGRTFHLEAENGAFQGILLSPVPKDAIFLAKALANFVFLYIVALLEGAYWDPAGTNQCVTLRGQTNLHSFTCG